VATHPTDIVFFYDEPYSKVRRYIQCDLKSYSKSSFSKGKISDALVSLAKQVACAEISSEWQGKYLVKGTTSEISGLLFVYNHDQEYHKEFGSLIGDLDVTELNLPPKSRLFLLGPDDINWLDRVVHDIKLMRGDEDDERRIPSRDCCAYYYPDLSRKTNVQADRARAATLEMLSSPWIVMQYFVEDSDVRKGVVVFYRRVPTVDGFKYLIDYLRHFQMFEVKSFNIDIRVNFDLGDAKIVFEKAIIEYLDEIAGKNSDTDFAKRLRKIRISAVPQLPTSFSQEQIGMDYGLFATDKELYDLLASSRQRMTERALLNLARDRRIFISHKAEREAIVDYLSCLPHDLQDVEGLIDEAEVGRRGEKTTFVEVAGDVSTEDIKAAIDQYVDEVGASEEITVPPFNMKSLGATIEYNEFDYSRTRLLQRIERKAALVSQSQVSRRNSERSFFSIFYRA